MLREQDILFEDNHLLVINKRAGIATMGVESGKPSLLNEAKAYIKEKYQKPGNVYLGVVSRIDSRVSGVIVFARTSKSASRLSAQFRERTTEKEYWAIVAPEKNLFDEFLGTLGTGLKSKATQIESWIYKDEPAMRMRCCSAKMAKQLGAKKALLEFSILGIHNDLMLLRIQLFTGRKHQIRCQLAEFGMPILGDQKYGNSGAFENGIALHSRILKIVHPTLKNSLQFEAPVPKQWKIGRFGHTM